MATDLTTLGNQMSNVENQLSQYDANLPSEIETQIKKAYTPALQQSLGVTRDLMGDYLGKYFDITSMGPGTSGTTAKDLSPVQKLSVMGNQLGTMSGQLQYSQKLSDYLGGQMTDMYSKAIQAAQLGQQNLADKYARISQQYQMAWQQAENEKDRALQRSLGSGGGGGTVINLGNTGTTGNTTTTDARTSFIQKANKYKNLIKTKKLDSNVVFQQLLKEAQSLGLGISSQQLSSLLGVYSSPAPTKNITTPMKYFNVVGSNYGGLSK